MEEVEIKEEEKEVEVEVETTKEEPPKQKATDAEVEKEDEARQAIRERRREERKAKKEARDRLIEELEQTKRENALLKQRIEEGLNRLSSIEQRSFSSDLERLDAAIQIAAEQVEEAKRIIEKGVAEQKGDAVALAQEALLDAKQRLAYYIALKERAVAAARQPRMPATDPVVAALAKEWHKRNPWYNPGDEEDTDSIIAFVEDQKLARQGWNPRTKEYWEELDRRLRKKLPHRYKDEEETSPSPTGGSARESAAEGGRIVLSKERVDALKEAGMWEQFKSDPKFRARMMARFKEADERR